VRYAGTGANPQLVATALYKCASQNQNINFALNQNNEDDKKY